MPKIEELIQNARVAQRQWARADQPRVDAAVRAMARAVFDAAEPLARRAVDETRMGVYEDKVRKNQGKARILWNSLRGKKTVGVLRRDEDTGIVEIAKPIGVVGAVTPCTNPIVTPLCNGMFAVKGRNAVIFAPHPRAVKSCGAFLDVVHAAWSNLDMPEHLLQYIDEPSIDATKELMRSVDLVVATGGMGMVKSAYSSGKPAYGVGAGNVQCVVDRDADIDQAVEMMIEGRRFDNGIICSGEQAAVVPREKVEQITEAFRRHRAAVIDDPAAKQKLLDALFVDGVMNRDFVGVTAKRIAERLNLSVPADTRVLMVPGDGAARDAILRKEKICPVMALFTYETFDEAIDIVCTNLDMEGKGHSVSIHSHTPENIEKLGLAAPVSRVIVNQSCSTSSGGSFYNGFAATTTLGCGSWGNNIISENLDYKHLINVTRIGLTPKNPHVPTDEELWS
ncbi:MAG: aldehyde dehydrogenase family protein [Phycisphaerae bacterium]|nr:aldehyde dehydrogenase family protein [Phycisphaerae bacterium]